MLVQYFFAQAESILTNIHDDQQMNRFEALCTRLLALIRSGGMEGVSVSKINSLVGRGTRAKERNEILAELVSRGLLSVEKKDRVTVFRAV